LTLTFSDLGIRAGVDGSIAGTINFIPETISAIVQNGSKRLNLPSSINELIKYPFFPAVEALIFDRKELMSWLPVWPLLLKCN